MTFTDREQRTILAVLDALQHLTYDEQNKFLGSVTIREAQDLYRRMRYAPYCERHGILYEDMTDSDFEDAYREECDA